MALARVNTPSAILSLKQCMLTDDAPCVRRILFATAKDATDPSYLELLILLLNSDIPHIGAEDLSHDAAMALIEKGTNAIPSLIAALQPDQDMGTLRFGKLYTIPDFKCLVMRILGAIGDPRAIEPLIHVVATNKVAGTPRHGTTDHARRRIHDVAIKALADVTGAQFGSDANKWEAFYKAEGIRLRESFHSRDTHEAQRLFLGLPLADRDNQPSDRTR